MTQYGDKHDNGRHDEGRRGNGRHANGRNDNGRNDNGRNDNGGNDNGRQDEGQQNKARNTGDGRLIWIDLEMTGLDTDRDSILEIATIVTDSQLNVLAEGPELAIAHSLSTLEAMDEWNRNQHGKSGLWHRVIEDGVSLAEAEMRTIAFLQEWVPANRSPMCGNSICQDRRFLHRLMPGLEQYFHYRNLDVSTIKELARRWAPEVFSGVRKQSAHTALSDVRDSIDELRHYRQSMGLFAAVQAPR